MVNASIEMEKVKMSHSKRKAKRISVSSKRQISIPKEFHEYLNIGEEVLIELVGNQLILKPVRETFGDFSEEILADLIAEGYTGEELMMEFKSRKLQIRPALDRLIEDNVNIKSTTLDDLFEEIVDE